MSIEIEIKKSRFIAYLVAAEVFEEELAMLKKRHKRARHFAWAYRFYEDGVLREKASDDGEPSGTAGRPILNVLQKQAIVGYAIVVVRYFGGVKLGAGGLVKAYSKAAASVVELFLDSGK